MFKLIVLACIVSVALGAAVGGHYSKERPKFSKSGKPILPLKTVRKIVGGSEISIEDAPYQIALEEDGYLICGGSIAGKNRVITAAHCTDGASAQDLQIRTGSDRLEAGGIVIQVASFAQNPGFDFWTLDFDVSVLTLDEDLNFTNSTQPIELTEAEPAGGDVATVSGWGTVHEGDADLPNRLRSVDVPIVDRETCNTDYDGELTENMICAGLEEGGKDSCQGDSGGPLVVGGKLAGIVSWGYGCAEPGYPGVYSNVNALKDWIVDHL